MQLLWLILDVRWMTFSRYPCGCQITGRFCRIRLIWYDACGYGLANESSHFFYLIRMKAHRIDISLMFLKCTEAKIVVLTSFLDTPQLQLGSFTHTTHTHTHLNSSIAGSTDNHAPWAIRSHWPNSPFVASQSGQTRDLQNMNLIMEARASRTLGVCVPTRGQIFMVWSLFGVNTLAATFALPGPRHQIHSLLAHKVHTFHIL